MKGNQIKIMKTSFRFSSLALIALLVAGTGFAQTDSDFVALPAYKVEAPRRLPAEKSIDSSLAQLRDAANRPIAIRPDLPSLHSGNLPALAAQEQHASVQRASAHGAAKS